ncbi:unnamed protein product [Rhizophagus irregularis]|nr:unnamed protein product [Rhizophagus irregularis]
MTSPRTTYFFFLALLGLTRLRILIYLWGRISLEKYDTLDVIKTLEKLLMSLIKNDYFQRSEIQIWERVIKLRFVQNSKISSNFIID